MRIVIIWFFLINPLISFLARSQADTIRPGKGQLLTGMLKPGLRQYLIYHQDPKNDRNLVFWYWVRDIREETRDGVRCFTIDQHWYGNDSSMYRTVYSVNARADFAPLYHREVAGGHLVAFNWGRDGIRGADTVAGNARKDFQLAFDAPVLNWNLDIETFEMLPLAAGKQFLINFYDAGREPPMYVLYSVKGSEELSLFGGEKTDCWKLVSQGKAPNGMEYTQTFWISKRGHEMLKEEDSYGGRFRLKVRMPDGMPDLVQRFRG